MVRESVAQHVLHQLTDFEVLGPSRRGVRTIRAFRPSSLALVWLACDLHFKGATDAALVDHEDWATWQLGRHEVRDSLDRLSDLGLWIIQSAGEVVRFSWHCKSWDEALEFMEGPRCG
jgi:hypothetical protein